MCVCRCASVCTCVSLGARACMCVSTKRKTLIIVIVLFSHFSLCHKVNDVVKRQMSTALSNTSFVTKKVCLSWQKFCRENITLVATKYFCHDKYLSRQTQFCRDKHIFVATNTKHVFCPDKSTLVETKLRVCCDKRHVLSRQKWYLWQFPPMIQLKRPHA